MSTITIPVSEQVLTAIRDFAAIREQSPERFLAERIEALLPKLSTWDEALEHVLTKNSELYRRLA